MLARLAASCSTSPEATALIADAVCEAARDGARLAAAIEAGRAVLGPDDVLPGVADIVGDVSVEAVFDDGTRLAVVTDPIGGSLGSEAPGAVITGGLPEPVPSDVVNLSVHSASEVPISITSHFHFFEVNRRLRFDRAAAYGRRLLVPAGSSVRFDPGQTREVSLVPIGGARIAIGFAGLVDGELDDPAVFDAAMAAAGARGYLMSDDERGASA